MMGEFLSLSSGQKVSSRMYNRKIFTYYHSDEIFQKIWQKVKLFISGGWSIWGEINFFVAHEEFFETVYIKIKFLLYIFECPIPTTIFSGPLNIHYVFPKNDTSKLKSGDICRTLSCHFAESYSYVSVTQDEMGYSLVSDKIVIHFYLICLKQSGIT